MNRCRKHTPSASSLNALISAQTGSTYWQKPPQGDPPCIHTRLITDEATTNQAELFSHRVTFYSGMNARCGAAEWAARPGVKHCANEEHCLIEWKRHQSLETWLRGWGCRALYLPASVGTGRDLHSWQAWLGTIFCSITMDKGPNEWMDDATKINLLMLSSFRLRRARQVFT